MKLNTKRLVVLLFLKFCVLAAYVGLGSGVAWALYSRGVPLEWSIPIIILLLAIGAYDSKDYGGPERILFFSLKKYKSNEEDR